MEWRRRFILHARPVCLWHVLGQVEVDAAPSSPKPTLEQNGVRAILRLYGQKVQGGALPKEV
jgi:hypothetical protein